jgi:predicted transcriptional regulator
MAKIRDRKANSYRLIDQAIREVYLEILRNENRLASQQEIADRVGVTSRTIRNHLSNVQLQQLALPFRALSQDVIVSLYKKAVSGDLNAIRVFLHLVHDWVERKEPELNEVSDDSRLLEKWLKTGRELLAGFKSNGEATDGE